MRETHTQAQKGQKVALVAALVIFALATVKVLTGLLCHADLLVADALHNVADVAALFASWMGLKFATKAKTKTFPYGLFKAETIALLGISLIFLWVAWELVADGIHKILGQTEQVPFSLLPLGVAALSAVCSFCISRYEYKAGRETNSATLLAIAKESFLDVVTSVVVLLGLVLTYYRVPYVEGVAIVAIGTLLAKLGVQNIIVSTMILLDANLDPQLTRQITREIAAFPGVKTVSAVRIRRSGLTRFVDLTLTASGYSSTKVTSLLASDIETHILARHTGIDSVMTQVEPAMPSMPLIAVPVDTDKGLESIVSQHFGCAPWFVLAKANGKKFQLVTTLPNTRVGSKKVGLHTAKMLCSHKIDVLIAKKVGEGPFHMLKDSGVVTFRSRNGTVDETIALYLANGLEQFDAASTEETDAGNDVACPGTAHQTGL